MASRYSGTWPTFILPPLSLSFSLSLSPSLSLSLSRMNFLVQHIDRENPLSLLHKTYCLQSLKWHRYRGKGFCHSTRPSFYSPHNLQMLISLPCTIHYKRLLGSIDSVYDLQILISNEACSFSGKNYLLCDEPETPWGIHLRCINSLKVS